MLHLLLKIKIEKAEILIFESNISFALVSKKEKLILALHIIQDTYLKISNMWKVLSWNHVMCRLDMLEILLDDKNNNKNKDSWDGSKHTIVFY